MERAPVVSRFSSRGPDYMDQRKNSADVLKPDILAPDNQIWAAWSPTSVQNPILLGIFYPNTDPSAVKMATGGSCGPCFSNPSGLNQPSATITALSGKRTVNRIIKNVSSKPKTCHTWIHIISSAYISTQMLVCYALSEDMNKALSILLRTKMRPSSPATNRINQMQFPPIDNYKVSSSDEVSTIPRRELGEVRESMHSAISMNKTEILDAALNEFSEGYFGLSDENRRTLLMTLAREYDLNRTQLRELMKQYLELELPSALGGMDVDNIHEEESSLSAFYRIERNLRHSLKPMYEVLFERLNTHTGGLRFLSIMRADILSLLMEENLAPLRALDSYLKEKLITWLSPANLQLHNITWDDPASLLEKIVAYEAVHPISNLLDLKRRLGVGRRCFGYLHPAIPGEPLIFIEVALMKNVAQTIQEVLWDDPPIAEYEATCALFYSISSTQPGLSGINLGKFLIKRVIDVVRKDMPRISTFATLSPIPGYMQWLLSKLASAERSTSTFREMLLKPEEESAILDVTKEFASGKNGMEVMRNLLSTTDYEWVNSTSLTVALQIPLTRLCARYLFLEKKRGKALDSVGNFHLQNGAMIGRINWMADRSEKGLRQSAGIMVNYIYEVENIEENAQSYFSKGKIQASSDVRAYIEPSQDNHEETKD